MSRRARAALAASVTLWALGAAPARADMIVELGPALSVGWTDNASSIAGVKQGDEFGTLSGAARGRYIGRKTEQSLGYRLSLTKYLEQHAADSASQEFSYVSTYSLAPKWDLTAGATGARSKTTAFVLQDESVAQMLAVAGAYLDYLTISANEGLSYRPTPRRRYVQSLTASRLTYLKAELPPDPTDPNRENTTPPDTTYVLAGFRGEWERARDTFMADLSFNDTYIDLPPEDASQGRNRLLIQGLGGYRREFNTLWSADAALGFVFVLNTDLAGVVAPAGLANVSYRRLIWFATLTVSQSAAPNIFLGNATLNDVAILRASLPLTRAETFVLSGNAGYTYARFATQGGSRKAYELFSTGVSVYWHPERMPVWASIDYSYTNQEGSMSSAGGIIPSRTRNAVILTLGGSFVFGKGTPPIFHGL